MRFLPGLALCCAVTAVALFLQTIETKLAGQPYIEALVLAILIGVAIRTVWEPSPRWDPGIQLSAKFLLEIAVMLLGASVSAQAVLAIGPAMIAGIAMIVIAAIATSYVICRALGIKQSRGSRRVLPCTSSSPGSSSASSWSRGSEPLGSYRPRF